MNNYSAARHAFRKAVAVKSPALEDAQLAESRLQAAISLCKGLKALRKLDHQKLDCTRRDHLTIQLCDKIGDLLVELEAYPAAVTFYMRQLDTAIRANKPDPFIATIYVSIAQTYMDDKKYEKAVDFFNKELELRSSNIVEQSRTFLKIIEATICMDKPSTDIISMYEKAIEKYGASETCKKRILKDYAIYLQQQGDSSRLQKVKASLVALAHVDVDAVEENICNDSTNKCDTLPLQEESLHLSDLSSDSSSSSESDEEVKSLNTCIVVAGCRPKRSVRKKIRTNDVGETPLHRACIEGDIKKVNKLIDSGHPINARDHCGWLPLHEAANHGFVEITQVLLDAGADINDPGGEKCGGTTPLHDACSNCHVDVIRLLISRGADVTKLDSEGNHALDCLRAWRSRVGDLKPQDECEYRDLVTLLEDKIKASGYDLNADKLMHRSIQVSTRAPMRRNITRRGLDDEEEISSHQPQPCSSSSTSFASATASTSACSLSSSSVSVITKKNPKNDLHDSSRSVREKEKDEEATVAREVYRSAIEKLRKGKTVDASQDTPGHEYIHSAPRSALLYETERIDVDEWLVDDLPRNSVKRSHDLFNCDLLRKKNRLTSHCSNRNERNTSKHEEKNRIHSKTTGSSDDHQIIDVDDGLQDVDFDVHVEMDEETDATQVEQAPKSDDLMGHEIQAKCTSSCSSYNSYSSSVNITGESTSQINSSGNNSSHHGRKVLIKVHVEGRAFLVKIPDEKKTVSWLAQEIAQRYFNIEKKKPVLYLETKDGAILSPDDLIIDVVMTDELCAIVQSFELLTPLIKYEEHCKLASVSPLSDIENLLRFCSSLDLSHTIIPSIHEKLLWQCITDSHITSLDLSYCDLSGEKKSTIFTAISSLRELEELKFRACGLISSDLYQLAEAKLSRLLHLDLSYNCCMFGPPLASLITSLPSVRTLSLISCDLTAHSLKEESLIDAINKSASLHQLLVEEKVVNEAASDSPPLSSKIKGTHFPSLTCNIRCAATLSTSNV